MLSEIDFNNTGGPLHFSHPCTVASEGTHLLLAGRNNNRVLIWDPLPTENWKKYKPIRGMIEDIFKLAKNAFSLKNLHRYTKRSVKKFVCLHVLLIRIVVSLGVNSKEELQKIAEW